MNLIDILKKSKPLDRIRRLKPEWKWKFIVIPENIFGELLLVDVAESIAYYFVASGDDITADDWDYV